MSGTYVEVRDGEKIENALKIFKRKVMRSGLMKDLRDRQEFTKPSVAKIKKQKAAASRRRREERRLTEEDTTQSYGY